MEAFLIIGLLLLYVSRKGAYSSAPLTTGNATQPKYTLTPVTPNSTFTGQQQAQANGDFVASLVGRLGTPTADPNPYIATQPLAAANTAVDVSTAVMNLTLTQTPTDALIPLEPLPSPPVFQNEFDPSQGATIGDFNYEWGSAGQAGYAAMGDGGS